jgi:hypothetical protein
MSPLGEYGEYLVDWQTLLCCVITNCCDPIRMNSLNTMSTDLLNRIHSPADLKGLDRRGLKQLADELRGFVLQSSRARADIFPRTLERWS